MKKLLLILIIGVMLFSIGMVAFANLRMEYCTATGGSHEVGVSYEGGGLRYYCIACVKIFI